MKRINFKKKKVKLLANEQQESYKNAKFAIFVQKSLKINMLKIKNIVKLEIIFTIQVNIELLDTECVIGNTVHLKKLSYFFIMDLTMVIILYERNFI